MNSQLSNTVTKPLRIMKFGGTSVGDASSIQKVAEIVHAAASESGLVVVVSAMSGVTNQLIDTAVQSALGDCLSVAAIFNDLRQRHETVVNTLIHSAAQRSRIGREMDRLFQEAEQHCQTTMQRREFSMRTRDLISGLGERLSAPIVAAVLQECGVASEAIEATELIRTDSCHDAAEPLMDATRGLCETRLHPLLRKGIVPVVTGFIGATAEGVLTTLGRGGSDYSATILGAALDADEVIIWTDVDGLMTADPRLVADASTIAEISYREAAELAHFGAKVLHPKTLRAVTQCGIPLWIRNTFASEQVGTKITPTGLSSDEAVRGLASISDAALITVGGPGMTGMPDVFGRILAVIAAVQANALLISQSSAQGDIHVVLSSALAAPTVDALRREFAADLAGKTTEHIALHPAVAIVTMVGQDMRDSGVVERISSALSRAGVNIIATMQASSGCSVSLAVARDDMKQALVATHREFQLDALDAQALPAGSHGISPAAWYYESQRSSVDAD